MKHATARAQSKHGHLEWSVKKSVWKGYDGYTGSAVWPRWISIGSRNDSKMDAAAQGAQSVTPCG